MNAADNRYALSTWLYGRALGSIFVVAFVSLWPQLRGLVGEHGIVPAASQLEQIAVSYGDEAHWLVPTLAWFGASDAALSAVAAFGTASGLLLAAGVLPAPALCGCVVSYVSLVNVGGPFTHFQWDVLLIEAGFASLLSTPIVLIHRPRATQTPPPLARWLLYALVVKVMFLSGVVKLASHDRAWADLTALAYHYETQPLPNPVSFFVHHLPLWFHKLSAAAMFGVELGMPLVALVPLAATRRTAALSFIGLMVMIMATGNYGFFNLLVIALALPLLDDALLRRVLPRRLHPEVEQPAKKEQLPKKERSVARLTERFGGAVGVTGAAALVVVWSAWALGEHGARIALALITGLGAGYVGHRTFTRRRRRVARLLRARLNKGLAPRAFPMWPRAMRAARRRGVETLAVAFLLGSTIAFVERLSRSAAELTSGWLDDVRGMHLFNSYGLFAVMTTRRPEIVIEGSRDGTTWQPYEFPYKPGPLGRAPPVLIGHMPRLDWQMWFAALGTYRHQPWIISLMRRLTEGEPAVLGLFEHNPFPGAPPRFVRALVYDYRFNDANGRARSGEWWRRGEPRSYAPMVRSRP